jgi:ribonuclease D
VLAVDTESNSLFAYRERVCLVQFSTPRADALVDTLALTDLSPLGAIFASPGIRKVFHAAEYDLLCLKRDYGFVFENLFDTMLAARILGQEEIGLGALLEAEFGVALDKRHQRADWGQRPLPPHLLDYARLDTHYLIPLHQRLEARLVERDLMALAQEDFTRLSQAPGFPNTKPAVDPWRVSGAADLDPRQMAVLMALCRYRDRLAQAQDRPLFKVFNDQALLEIARRMPTTEAELAETPGLSNYQRQRYAAQLLDAVQQGRRSKPPAHAPNARPSEATLAALDRLRRWRKATAQQMGVSSDVVLPRDLLYSLAEARPHDLPALAGVMKEAPWRLEHFGAQILKTLDDKSPTDRRR